MIFSPDDVIRMLKSLKRVNQEWPEDNEGCPFQRWVSDTKGKFIYSKNVDNLIQYLEDFKRGYTAMRETNHPKDPRG